MAINFKTHVVVRLATFERLLTVDEDEENARSQGMVYNKDFLKAKRRIDG